MKARLAIAAALILAACSPDTSTGESWLETKWLGVHAGEPTRVLTLGSTHLAQSEVAPARETLEPLLAKLEDFAPDLITIENLSGLECDHVKRFPTVYQGIGERYCRDTTEAEAASGLDVPAAVAGIRETMIDWPAEPSASERRALALLFLSAGEHSSALVQWLQLSEAERIAADGLTPALVEILEARAENIGENNAVAAVLAARLGHVRVYPVDDHTGDEVYYTRSKSEEDALSAFLSAHFTSERHPFYDELEAREAAVTTGEEMLDFYRYMNRESVARRFVELDFVGAASKPSAGDHGRTYLAWWEVRNMRMAANVRAVAARHHGARVLNVVGASHKEPYDRYLGQMADIEIVNAEAVLE